LNFLGESEEEQEDTASGSRCRSLGCPVSAPLSTASSSEKVGGGHPISPLSSRACPERKGFHLLQLLAGLPQVFEAFWVVDGLLSFSSEFLPLLI
jgi:hypothetical protein